jgi:hypothetical protein
MSNHKKSGTLMTSEAAARIQSAEAIASGGGVDRNNFASRAQSAAASNERPSLVSTLPPEVFNRILEKCKIHS